MRGWSFASRSWLGTVPERRNSGTGDDRARYFRRRAAGRWHHGRVQQEVHARLQYALIRGRRGQTDPRARPPRDRPRCLGRAIGRADLARPRALPLHHPRDLGHPRVEWLELHGLGLRRHAQPDGCRRADQRPRRRDLDRLGPGRGVRPPHPLDRYHRRRGPLRRHGLQGRRDPAGHHRHPA